MRKILVATHASFAQGIKETLNFILGEQEQVCVMNAYTEQDFDIEKEIAKVLQTLDKEDELIVLVDLFGGSVSTAFSNHIEDTRIHVISGVNFPMLLDISLNQDKDIQKVINRGMEAGKTGIIYVNQLIESQQEEQEDF